MRQATGSSGNAELKNFTPELHARACAKDDHESAQVRHAPSRTRRCESHRGRFTRSHVRGAGGHTLDVERPVGVFRGQFANGVSIYQFRPSWRSPAQVELVRSDDLQVRSRVGCIELRLQRVVASVPVARTRENHFDESIKLPRGRDDRIGRRRSGLDDDIGRLVSRPLPQHPAIERTACKLRLRVPPLRASAAVSVRHMD